MKAKILPIAVLLCAAAAVVMTVMIFAGGQEKDFTPPPFEQNATAGVPSVPEDAGYAEADAEAFRFSAAANLQVQDGKVDIWLTNPSDNDVWMKVRIISAENEILGESGILKQGEYVQSVVLDTVPQGSTDVSLKIMAYEPDTYQSAGAAVLKTKLNVS